SFRPSLIVSFDLLLNQQNHYFFRNNFDIPKILSYKSRKDIGKGRNDLIYAYYVVDSSFCYDPTLALSARGNTVYIALQILYHMGFKEVALVGADHNFPDLRPQELSLNKESDKFHFH